MRNRLGWVTSAVLTAGNIILLLLIYFVLVAPPRTDPVISDTGNGIVVQQVGPTPTLMPFIEIVIAIQDIPRGLRIPPDAVALRPWPEISVPFNAAVYPEEVIGKIARSSISREQPILITMLTESFLNLSDAGSELAAAIPSGLVAKTIRLARADVPLGVAVGDRVDAFVSYPQGAAEAGSTTVLLLQNALVLWIGELPADGRLFLAATPTPYYYSSFATPAPTKTAAALGDVVPVVLGIGPQDAAELVWAEHNQIPLALVMRPASDTALLSVTPVSRQTLPR